MFQQESDGHVLHFRSQRVTHTYMRAWLKLRMAVEHQIQEQEHAYTDTNTRESRRDRDFR